MKKDHYRTLGISRQASDKDIKAAYRKQARETHPDMNPGDNDAEARFKDVSEAYQTLSDPEKKAEYDQKDKGTGPKTMRNGRAGGFQGAEFSGFTDFFDDIDNIFDMFFGSARWWHGWNPNRSQARSSRRDFEESFENRTIFERGTHSPEPFVDMSGFGRGGTRGTTHGTCNYCGGTGELRVERKNAFERFISIQTCPYCGGRGVR